MVVDGTEANDYDECEMFSADPLRQWRLDQVVEALPSPYMFDFCFKETRELVENNCLEHFMRQPATWPQEASRGSFWSISGASAESGPRRPPEGRFGAFQAPARTVAPGGLQRVVLDHFRAPRMPILRAKLHSWNRTTELIGFANTPRLAPA